MAKKRLGQYFTTNNDLQRVVSIFIRNNPEVILEPSVGRGDLLVEVLKRFPFVALDLYEIDDTLDTLNCIKKEQIIFCDFLTCEIHKKYRTIISNPPFIKLKKEYNQYIKFIEKCIELLDDDGELIVIVPSDFFYTTSAISIIKTMLINGTFTDIYNPHNDKLFEGATIDVIVFRYQKTQNIDNSVKYNDKQRYLFNVNGMVLFRKINTPFKLISDYFNAYVGLVSGKETIFKNDILANTEIIIGKNKVAKYILLDSFPSNNENINDYMLSYKNELLERKIRKFNDKNWFEWGALRNINVMKEFEGERCIYVKTLTRHKKIAFKGRIALFGANLIMLKPKYDNIDIKHIVKVLNSTSFRKCFTFSGRFKIGQRQLLNAPLDI
ncbi:Ribosomal RNA small subunit methyltransferase C [uncultured archaeon]|nr:Ribosomal RNA small subunit methyltransferase C [uncultured archaeon]